MAVTLGNVTFDPAATTVRETHEEVGGRRERVIELSGVISGLSGEAAIHDALDAILDEASAEDYSAILSVRPGRRLLVRRAQFVRDVSGDARTGAFQLKLSARGPFEESAAVHSTVWPITASGATLPLTPGGNTASPVVIELSMAGTVINPSISDGIRAIGYAGTLTAGDVLVFDAVAGDVLLNDESVLAYASGVFPALDPDGTTLTYADDASSSHLVNATVEYRDRWW